MTRRIQKSHRRDARRAADQVPVCFHGVAGQGVPGEVQAGLAVPCRENHDSLQLLPPCSLEQITVKSGALHAENAGRFQDQDQGGLRPPSRRRGPEKRPAAANERKRTDARFRQPRGGCAAAPGAHRHPAGYGCGQGNASERNPFPDIRSHHHASNTRWRRRAAHGNFFSNTLGRLSLRFSSSARSTTILFPLRISKRKASRPMRIHFSQFSMTPLRLISSIE